MFPKIFSIIFAVLVIQQAGCAGPVQMTKSYIAWGEISQSIRDMDGAEMQVAFEETYDADSQNSAFIVWVAGKNVTFVTNYKTNETFRYMDGTACDLTDEKEWIKSQYPPGLLVYENDDGTIRFSLRQLFNIPDKFLLANKQGTPATYRGIPAKLWLYEIPGRDDKDIRRKLNIYSYWSDGTWDTSSNENMVPLGFTVVKTSWNKLVTIDEINTSVFGFVTETYDHKVFEPFQGIICPNRSQTYKFPSVQNIRALSIQSEMILPDYQEIRYIDTFFDPQSQLIRIDVERIRDENPIEERKAKRYESEIAIGKMGVVYRQSVFKDGLKCDVIPFNQYENDVQNFVDIKQNLANWKMAKFFGLNATTYVYTGTTVKRDIPCHVFQGIRTDWPEESANVTSLWEWCFNVNMTKENEIVLFLNNDIGIISAQVTILSSDIPQQYPPNFRMFHHFYEITEQDPAILDATRFDISRCFRDENRRDLQFYLDYNVTNDNKHVAENLTGDVSFLQKWKSTIYRNSGLPDYSLRIAKVQAMINLKKLFIKFLILDNKNLPKDVWLDQISAFEAERNLRDNIQKRLVYVTHPTENGPITFKPVNGSMSVQLDPDFEHREVTTMTTRTETSSTEDPFSLRTEPEKSTKSTHSDDGTTGTKPSRGTAETTKTTPSVPTTQTEQPQKQKVFKYFGHQPGAVAAVSIAMLLTGITAGSGGMFYKYFGFPSCFKR